MVKKTIQSGFYFSTQNQQQNKETRAKRRKRIYD